MWDRLHIVSSYQTIHASTPFFTAPSCAHITSHFLLPWMHGPYKLSIRNSCPVHFASILDSKLDNSTSPPTRLVLTQWLGQPPEDTTWEPWQELRDTYHLEDKVVFEGEGIVSNSLQDDEGAESNEPHQEPVQEPHQEPVQGRSKCSASRPSYLQDYET